MTATGYSFQMAGGVPVVTAPAEIDITTAGELRTIFCEWQSRGHTTVVVDLTATQFCDSTGLRELVWAHKRAVAEGGGLHLVMPVDGAFLHIFTVTGLGGIIPHYATLGQALAQLSTASRPLRRGPPRRTSATPAADGLGTDHRNCEHCGAVFVPVREHARFCTSDCRAAWNCEHLGDPAVDASALTWSMAAMSEATARLPAVKVWDRERAFTVIGEAVWWITMVDATLVRHHPAAYDTVMAAQTRAERLRTVEASAGLRYVRNWIGRGTPLDETIESGAGARRITYWTWKPLGEPALAGLPPRAQAWELARYRAYQARLAGHPIGKTFSHAVTFLALACASAAPSTDTSQPAAPDLFCG